MTNKEFIEKRETTLAVAAAICHVSTPAVINGIGEGRIYFFEGNVTFDHEGKLNIKLNDVALGQLRGIMSAMRHDVEVIQKPVEPPEPSTNCEASCVGQQRGKQ